MFGSSFTVVLAAMTTWLAKLNSVVTDITATCVGIAGVIMVYYTIRHLIEKIKSTKLDNESKKLDNELKRIEIEKAKEK